MTVIESIIDFLFGIKFVHERMKRRCPNCRRRSGVYLYRNYGRMYYLMCEICWNRSKRYMLKRNALKEWMPKYN